MTWKLGPLTLTKVVSDASDDAQSLSLSVLLTAAERLQLRELCAYRGSVERIPLAGGDSVVVDTTGDRNTLYVSSGAASHVTSGWFAVNGYNDGWQGPTYAEASVDLVQIAGNADAAGSVTVTATHLSGDF